MLLKLLLVMLVAMLPVIELRGAIPIAASMNLPEVLSLITAMVGNILPMPLIFVFAHGLLEKGSQSRYKSIKEFCKWIIKKGHKASDKLQTKNNASIYVALFLFVGIPLPGTGAWTGTIAATFLDLDFKKTMVAIGCGTLLAGLIILCLSFGAVNFFSYSCLTILP